MFGHVWTYFIYNYMHIFMNIHVYVCCTYLYSCMKNFLSGRLDENSISGHILTCRKNLIISIYFCNIYIQKDKFRYSFFIIKKNKDKIMRNILDMLIILCLYIFNYLILFLKIKMFLYMIKI